jgi:hypothetical protein
MVIKDQGLLQQHYMRYVAILFILCVSSAVWGSEKSYTFHCRQHVLFDVVGLVLDDDGNYVIETEIVTKIQGPWGVSLSSGIYVINKDSVKLIDGKSNYIMYLVKEGKDLRVLRAYPFFQKGLFKYAGQDSYAKPLSAYKDINLSDPYKKQKHTTPATISPGIFSFRGNDPQYSYWQCVWLDIGRNKYKAYLGKSLLSEGSYKQLKDQMVLHDKTLDHNFTFRVINDTLIVAKEFIGPYYEFFHTTKKQDHGEEKDIKVSY